MFVNNKWDARYFQIIFQLTFLSYGIFYLGWQANWILYTVYIFTALATQWVGDSIVQQKAQPILGKHSFVLKGGLSALISAASLCLLLKTNHLHTAAIASFISVASKYIFRINGKHIFNPSALGIVVMLYFSGDSWLLPAQWGSNAVIFFMVATLGTIMITKVQKLDVCFAFLFTFLGLMFYRQVVYLNWGIDFFWQTMSTGSLLLFTFFMISDPKTAPNHKTARLFWGVTIGAISFYVTAFHFMNAAPIKVLVIMAPLVPVLDYCFKQQQFSWIKQNNINMQTNFKLNIPNFGKKLATVLLVLLFTNNDLWSFCGFYVAKADGTIKNKTSQVIMVRDGNKNVITMYNDYKGDFKDFAMVVPVPTVLKQNDIKVVDQNIFNTLNDYSKPRLVEYWDQNPCNKYDYLKDKMPLSSAEVVVSGYGNRKKSADRESVRIEAQYIIGEYDILILSATESTGLKTWLASNGYKIPESADEVLEPYIKSNLKFFVVKVNMEAKKKLPGDFLRPLQITFNSPKFMLPIRLGMANADGDQDMIVYAFTKKGRVECTNYRTVSLPTGNNIPLFVNQNFGTFYGNLFQHQWTKEGKNVAMLEYAWNVTPQPQIMKCDPCVATAPSAADLVQAGVWWLKGRDWNDYSDVDDEEVSATNEVYFTRLHVRYNREKFAQDLNFMLTPNKENYQARYVINHPAEGDFSCEEGKKYLTELKKRRRSELKELTSLTGKTYQDWDVAYTENEENEFVAKSDASYAMAAAGLKKDNDNDNNKPNGALLFGAALLGLAALVYIKQKNFFSV
jgi:Na+-transporting NADH:ubiquinone oxidoreductase subunit NqrB